jgi:prevent-host-death family protein
MDTVADTVGAYEAKTHLPRLLDAVAKGKTITITKHGVPVAKLVPIPESRRKGVAQVIRELREHRRGITLGEELTSRDLIEEGRRY